MLKGLRALFAGLLAPASNVRRAAADSSTLPNQSHATTSGALSGAPVQEDRSAPMRKARSAVDERMRAVFDD